LKEDRTAYWSSWKIDYEVEFLYKELVIMQLNKAFLNINSLFEHQIVKLKLNECHSWLYYFTVPFLTLCKIANSVGLDVHRTAFVVPTLLHPLCNLKGLRKT